MGAGEAGLPLVTIPRARGAGPPLGEGEADSLRVRQFLPNVLTAAVVFLTLSLVIFPKDAFEASVNGMVIFWNIVFPSLLPFFVLSDVMLGLGVVHFIGVFFEPLMRPLFSVPGEGAFALSMGLAAGYPMDAVITTKFRKAGMCTKVEGERLLAFTNTADPLFMFGAVAVGMFGMPALGATLAIAHYISSFLVGVTFKLHGVRSKGTEEVKKEKKGNILFRALNALYQARVEDGRPFGRLLGDAVNESMKTMLMIGGFIMTFSVLIRVLTVTGATTILSLPLGLVFDLLGVDQNLVTAAFQGIFEIDLGTVAASKAVAPFAQKVMVASAVIAWSGLSVHGQVASVLTGTDISMVPYAFARLLHAVLAAVITLLLTGPGAPAVAAVYAPIQQAVALPVSLGLPPFWQHLEGSLIRAALVPMLLFGLSVTLVIARSFRITLVRRAR